MLALFSIPGTRALQNFLLSAVRISKPVLSVVGGMLVFGKDFQVLCHSDNGSLPIIYSLSRPNKQIETRVVSKPGEQAIFNVSALSKTLDINNTICQARNSRHGPVTSGALQYIKLIGMLDAKALGNK